MLRIVVKRIWTENDLLLSGWFLFWTQSKALPLGWHSFPSPAWSFFCLRLIHKLGMSRVEMSPEMLILAPAMLFCKCQSPTRPSLHLDLIPRKPEDAQMWCFTLGPSARGKGSSCRQRREAMRTGNERSQIGKVAGFMKRAKFVLWEGANLGWSLERHCWYLCPSVLLGERLAACFRNVSVIQG